RIVVRAEAYAGNAVDGATVRYRVVRQTIYPYHWMFGRINFPNAAETEIKNGLLVTGMDGSGAIYFPALPDKSADTAASPYFQYTIHVDVIDLNGETRSNSQSLNIGYRSLRIITSIPEKAMPKQLHSIS